jgi:hypothetical protein
MSMLARVSREVEHRKRHLLVAPNQGEWGGGEYFRLNPLGDAELGCDLTNLLVARVLKIDPHAAFVLLPIDH